MKASYVGISVGALVSGVLVICFGVGLINLPYFVGRLGGDLGAVFLEAVDLDFLEWLRWLGVITVVQGLYQVSTFFLRAPTLIGRIIRVGDALLGTLAIPLLLRLRQRAEIVPIYLNREGERWSDAPRQDLDAMLRWVLLLIVIGIIVGLVAAVVRVFSPPAEELETARAR